MSTETASIDKWYLESHTYEKHVFSVRLICFSAFLWEQPKASELTIPSSQKKIRPLMCLSGASAGFIKHHISQSLQQCKILLTLLSCAIGLSYSLTVQESIQLQYAPTYTASFGMQSECFYRFLFTFYFVICVTVSVLCALQVGINRQVYRDTEDSSDS